MAEVGETATIATSTTRASVQLVDDISWSAGKPGSSFANTLKHFGDHGAEFGFSTAEEYAAAAKMFVASPPDDIVMIGRLGGDEVLYSAKTNSIAIVTEGNEIKTFFKPGDQFKYFLEQDLPRGQKIESIHEILDP